MPSRHGGLMHGLLSGQEEFSGWSSQAGAYSAALGCQGGYLPNPSGMLPVGMGGY